MATALKEDSDGVLLVDFGSKPLIRPILGRVSADIEIDDSAKPASNNTRWVFDVENGVGDIAIQLLDPHSGRVIHPDLMSLSLLPRSESFYAAKPFVKDIDGGSFTIQHVKNAPACSYRVAVDVLHSATR